MTVNLGCKRAQYWLNNIFFNIKTISCKVCGAVGIELIS